MASKTIGIQQKGKGVYHHGDLKTSLKKAALRLVLDKGPRGFSLNEASRLAGVTVAAPYRHFEDKNALLAEIATDGFLELAANVQKAADASGERSEGLQRAGLAYLQFAAQHPAAFAVMFSASLDKTKYPLLATASRDAFATILALTCELERNKTAAMQQAVACWALVHGLATLYADGAFISEGEQKLTVDPQSLLKEFVSKIFLKHKARA